MTEKTTIKSPMPGVFYRRPDPGEDLFADVGDTVETGDVVGLVGVMKNFHDVTVERPGTITEFFVENEAEVTAGQELVEIEVDN
ncbi:acetyl-CoA carboxylase [Haladaptatus caseinilyticus]|uniref:acetyl-CoA carboxylase n=1 Tax=Haladaptatus caseinilyticus TaxID=2993314 RepID=UPI00224B8534|nr:acetyl-CoA carboxylase [Haladaptatus caseinilyticus]